MSAVARMAVLDLRTFAPYRLQALLLFGLVLLIDIKSPAVIVPALVVLVATQVASYPFMVGDKAGLDTLYAVLPLPRRAVLHGHYAWAVASFVAVAGAGTALALALARAETTPLTGRTLATELTLSWVLFAVNVAIQFPLFIRFGYTRAGSLGTTVPLALVLLVIVKQHVTIASVQTWLPLLGLAGVAILAASAAVALAADRRRMRLGARRRPTNRPAG